jgi:hypothetical protein
MDFVKQIRVSPEGAETGFRAEVDYPTFVFEARKVGGIGIPENTPAEGDELLFSFG